MYKIKLFSSSGRFIGETEEENIDDAMEIVKSHITSNDTIAVVSDNDYIDSINIC